MTVDISDLIKEIFKKQDLILDKISNIDITLAKQHENLQLHIYRTHLNEEQIKQLKQHHDESIQEIQKQLQNAIEKIDKKIKPIETHILYLNGVLKFFGLVSLSTSILLGIYKLITLF